MKIFSKSKYGESMSGTPHWVERCNGRRVTEADTICVGGRVFGITNQWCVHSQHLMKIFADQKIAVYFTEQWQRDTFLTMCQEASMTWRNFIDATSDIGMKFSANIGISFNFTDNGHLGYSDKNFYLSEGWRVVSYLDFVNLTGIMESTKENKHEITITSNGVETTATFAVKGKVIKTATARCHPEDRFDFHKGAEIAFNRLFEKEVEKVDTYNLKIGDKVRVRHDLRVGCAYNGVNVVEEMLEFRDKVVTISDVFKFDDPNIGVKEYYLREDTGDWYWSPDMLVPIK